jgi:hypothetical protein
MMHAEALFFGFLLAAVHVPSTNTSTSLVLAVHAKAAGWLLCKAGWFAGVHGRQSSKRSRDLGKIRSHERAAISIGVGCLVYSSKGLLVNCLSLHVVTSRAGLHVF